MKVQIGFKMAVVTLILALAVIPGLAQGLPAAASPASASGGFIWFTKTVDSTGDRGTHTSIAFDPSSGTPWISYYDQDNGNLMVAHRVGSGGNCGPNNEWKCETVDSTGDVGQNSSIDVYDDPHVICDLQVGVAYQDVTLKALKFAQYSCVAMPQCTCSWSAVTIDQGDTGGLEGYGRYTSIKYDADGNPHIAYYVARWQGDISVSELRYAHRVSGGGNCGVGSAAGKWQCDIVDGGASGGTGQYASLDLNSSGTPYIAYYDGNTGDLKYALRWGTGTGNCGSGNNWYCSTVDGTGSNVGQSASLGLSDILHFAYYDATNGKLKYAYSVSTGSGNCGPGNSFRCLTIDDAASPSGARSISLAVDGADNPLIAYRYASGNVSQLRVAQPGVGNCGPVECSGWLCWHTWQCLTVDTESGLGDIASHVSADFDPDDLPMIAYSERFYHPIGGSSDYDLMIAYGRIGVFLPLVLRNSP